MAHRNNLGLKVGVCLLVFGSSLLLAAPVDGVFTYHQPDGSTLKVRVIGDEFFAEEETLDGRRIIQDPVTKFWCYARLSMDATTLESSGDIAEDIDEQRAIAWRLPEHRRLKTPREERMRIAKANRERLGRDAKGRFIRSQTQANTDLSMEGITTPDAMERSVGGTTLGTKTGLTLLIRFPDRAQDVTISTTQVQNFCNQTATHYTEFGNNGSVAEYFYEVSNGKLTYTNTVANYYTTKYNRSYYTDENVYRASELVKEVLNSMEASNYNFRAQDPDGNGVIDNLNVFYAGDCVNSWGKGLWPHSGGLSWTSAKTGIRVEPYQMTDMGTKLELGTFIHENGHMLCDFPDVYDYDHDSGGGAGRFCLMNAGGHGTNPCAPNGYLRYKAGWGSPETITSATSGTKTLTAESNGRLANQFLVYFNPSNSKEYFLIENRYKNDRDAGLPTGGIAVWHVDEQGNHNKQNYTHNSTHNNFEVALIQADNQRHLERNSGSGDANDLFYAGGASSQFSDSSDSGAYDNNAHWWNGSQSGLKLTSFSAKGNSMSLTVGGGGGGGTASERILNGGFESGTTNWTATSGVIGTHSGQPAYEGTKNAWMCGYGSSHTDTLYQQVSIPSTATSAILSFCMHIDTAETTTTRAYDKLDVTIQSSSGSVLKTLRTFSNLNKNTGYSKQTFDVSAYKGQTIRVHFKATEDSVKQTSFVLDKVSLLAQ